MRKTEDETDTDMQALAAVFDSNGDGVTSTCAFNSAKSENEARLNKMSQRTSSLTSLAKEARSA